ncbi:hypothetical protein [Bdellovibrio sp. HCB337]|uniref:hypothetical protein n=1 Tax=Bdellovibrio sp. HCB337 TaxID=3394358 RepID=UPI0039A50DD7
MKHLVGLFIFWIALSAMAATLVNPQNDPDVAPHIKRGFFELPAGSQLPMSGMTLEFAQEIRNDFLTFAKKSFPKNDRELLIDLQWDNPFYSANARYKPEGLVIAVWGGFLRAPGLTPAILAYTFCHELGHLVGGEPKQTNERGENVSTEGVSDLFAALRCTDRFLQEYPAYQPSTSKDVAQACEGHKSCELSLQAGFESFRFLQKWGYESYEPVVLNFVSPEATEFIPNTYPSNQCRMETVLQGAVCLKNGKISDCTPPPCWWPRGLKYPQ